MRNKCVYVWSFVAALIMTACSDLNENSGSGETGQIDISIRFDGEKVPESRATVSTAVPGTSWAENIEQVQILLYDANKNVITSTIETPTASGTLSTIGNIPVGIYTVVAVANAKSTAKNKISTYLDGGTTPEEWSMWNVRRKNISNLVLKPEQITGVPD